MFIHAAITIPLITRSYYPCLVLFSGITTTLMHLTQTFCINLLYFTYLRRGKCQTMYITTTSAFIPLVFSKSVGD